MQDGNKIQEILRDADLFSAVRRAGQAIRDSYEVDALNQGDRELACLCYAIELNQKHGRDVLSVLEDIEEGKLLTGNWYTGDYHPDLGEKTDATETLERLQRDVRYLESGPDSY